MVLGIYNDFLDCFANAKTGNETINDKILTSDSIETRASDCYLKMTSATLMSLNNLEMEQVLDEIVSFARLSLSLLVDSRRSAKTRFHF